MGNLCLNLREVGVFKYILVLEKLHVILPDPLQNKGTDRKLFYTFYDCLYFNILTMHEIFFPLANLDIDTSELDIACYARTSFGLHIAECLKIRHSIFSLCTYPCTFHQENCHMLCYCSIFVANFCIWRIKLIKFISSTNSCSAYTKLENCMNMMS